MGFSISWVAFKGLGKADVLDRTGFRATGQVSENTPSDDAPFAFCTFPTGWSAIFSADYRYAAAESLGHLSEGATALGVQLEEHMMASAAALYKNGRKVWRIAHDSNRGLRDLQVSGTPPLEFEPIREKLFARQAAEPRQRFGTDHVYDIPVELAQVTTGYRHDELSAWGASSYEVLENVRWPI